MKIREAIQRGNEKIIFEEEQRKQNELKEKSKGYVMSSYAIKQKAEREGLIVKKFNINREKKKKGIKYWKRYMGNTFRPRRSSIKRTNHMWDKRMVLDRNVSRRGSYIRHSRLKRT